MSNETFSRRLIGMEDEFYPYISPLGLLQRIVALALPTTAELASLGVRRRAGRCMLRPTMKSGAF